MTSSTTPSSTRPAAPQPAVYQGLQYHNYLYHSQQYCKQQYHSQWQTQSPFPVGTRTVLSICSFLTYQSAFVSPLDNTQFHIKNCGDWFFEHHSETKGVKQEIARTQSPTIRNYAFELPTFGVIVGVNPTVVQWSGLTLEEPPS